MKTCILMNMAPKYVEPAYTLFDQELDILWCFGSNDTDIKEMDHSLLKNVKVFKTKHIFGNAYFLKNAISLAFRKDIDNYILIGEPAMLTTWILPWMIKIFRKSCKVSFWTHGWYGKEGKIKSFIKKLYFSPADYILTYGDRARRLMTEAGFDPKRIKVIHNSLNHSTQVELRNKIEPSNIYRSHFKNNYPVLFFIGRLTHVKRLDMIIEAVYKLKSKGENYNIVFVGTGEEELKLKTLVKDRCLDDNVWFYGSCYDEKENAELIYNADLCVAPGNVGLTAMHVMVFGTPVLTHDDFSWQMPEYEAIKDGKTGCFFKKDDVDSLAETISQWFSNNVFNRDEVRAACYSEIDNYWTPKYELKVLKEVLN